MDFSNWVNVVAIAIPALLALAGLAYGIYAKVKSKQYVDAAKDGVKIVEEVAKAVDAIKKGTEGTPSRTTVSSALKTMGGALEAIGLKGTLDQTVSKLNLDNKS
jgi:hypothetical protein